MTPEDCRDLVNREKIPISFLSRETSLDFDQLAQFIKGEEAALSAQVFESLCRFISISGSRIKDYYHTLNDQKLDGISDHLTSSSVAFVSSSKNGELEVASGTLVCIGPRLFVATAGHPVKQTRMLQFIGSNVGNFEACKDESGKLINVGGRINVEVVKFGSHSGTDTGFFELEASHVETLGRTPISISRLGISGIEYGDRVYLYGYPRDLISVLKEKTGDKHIPLCSITYPAPLLDPREWPDSTNLSPTQDCVIRYSLNDEYSSIRLWRESEKQYQTDFDASLPSPFGISGGGLWQSQGQESSIWRPDTLQLIAIQRSWTSDREHLRLTQIHHWLRLIQSKYPDLSAEISHRLEQLGLDC